MPPLLETPDAGDNGASWVYSSALTKMVLAPRVTVNVKDPAYGAVGDGVANDTTAIQAAINTGAGTVVFPPGTYLVSSTVTLGSNTRLVGAGSGATKIKTTSAIETLVYNPGTGSADITSRASIEGVTIEGTSAGTSGLRVSDCFGFRLVDVTITGFTTGAGLHVHNIKYWTEGLEATSLTVRTCATGIRFQRTSASGGTDSFAYTKLHSIAINVPASGVGIDMAQGDAAYMYHSEISGQVWLASSAIGLRVASGDLIDKTVFTLFGENESGATATVGVSNAGTIKGTGYIRIASSSNTYGTLRVLVPPPLDGISGTASSITYRQAFTANIDTGHDAGFGFREGSNLSDTYTTIYNGTSNKFAVRRVNFDSTPSAATEVFSVLQDGTLTLLSAALILSGTGSPQSSKTAPVGSLFLRTDGGAATTLYVKELGTGSTGWVAK